MAKKKEEDNILFTFKGATFYKDTLYKVNNKLDLDAPKSWRNHGISKAPVTGDTASCPYDRRGQRYDTGFDVYSPRYSNIETSVAKNSVSLLTKEILQPYLKVTGKTTEELSLHSKSFWDSFMVTFNENTSFNTADPVKAMELYIAVVSGRLVPKSNKNTDLEGHPYFSKASYVVYSDRENIEVRNVVTKNKYEAIKIFSQLVESDVKMLKMLMMFIDVPVTNINTQEGLMDAFGKNIEPETSKVSQFLNASEKLETDEGKLEVQLFYYLKQELANKKIVKRNSKIYFDSVEIGDNLKNAARELANSEAPYMVKIKNELLGL